MNGFDIALLTLTAVLVVLGLLKGLVRILIGVAALVAAFALAARFHRSLADALTGLWGLAEEPLRLIAYLGIFLGVMLVGATVAFVLRRLVRAAMLGWADRLAGAALGFAAAALSGALIVLPLVAYSPYSERLLARSVLAPYVTAVADLANRVVPEDLSRRYQRGVEDLRRRWRDSWFRENHADPDLT